MSIAQKPALNQDASRSVAFGEICKVQGGFAFKSQEYTKSGIPLVRISNLVNGRVSLDEVVYISESKITEHGAFLLNRGDTLIAMSGATTGKMAVFDLDCPALLNQRVGRFKIHSEEVSHPKYVAYAVRRMTEQVLKSAYGAAQPNISPTQIEEFSIPLPPLPIQKQIVAEIEKQFTRLDAGIGALKRVQAKLKRHRAAVLKAACEGKLVTTEAELRREGGDSFETGEELHKRMLIERRKLWNGRGRYKEPLPADCSDMPVIPSGWSWASADEITNVITDGEHITPARAVEGILLLSARNVLDGRISLNDVDYVPQHEYERIAKRLVINAGDVLLSCSGSVGRSAVVPEGMLFTLVRSVAVLKPLLAIGKYLSIALRSPLLKHQITKKQTQTAQANIFQGKIKVLCIPLPPLAEQKRIVAEVERRLSVVEELEAVVSTNLQRATRLRQSILQKAFSGDTA